jgi:hypothetical protein
VVRLSIVLAVAVHGSGMGVPILAPDGAVYAGIAKTMVERHNFVELMVQGQDWLDKPHFPFWLTALAFRLFGVQAWAYKLPALLCLLLGAWSTYWFARQFYPRQVARWAVLIVFTAQHTLLATLDVRAEAYLTGLIMTAVASFATARRTPTIWPLLLGALCTAGALMTTGLVALLPIGGTVAGDLVRTQHWPALWHRRWWGTALVLLVGLAPELYCLYAQFDAHPDKLVSCQVANGILVSHPRKRAVGGHGGSALPFWFWPLLHLTPAPGRAAPMASGWSSMEHTRMTEVGRPCWAPLGTITSTRWSSARCRPASRSCAMDGLQRGLCCPELSTEARHVPLSPSRPGRPRHGCRFVVPLPHHAPAGGRHRRATVALPAHRVPCPSP